MFEFLKINHTSLYLFMFSGRAEETDFLVFTTRYHHVLERGLSAVFLLFFNSRENKWHFDLTRLFKYLHYILILPQVMHGILKTFELIERDKCIYWLLASG